MHCSIRFIWIGAAVVTLLTTWDARGQSDSDSEWNHFGLNFRLGLNIKAKFSNIGAAAQQSAPSPTGVVDHTYTDGFVKVDSSGDRGGLTWNWGYQNASQIVDRNTLLMHASSTEAVTSTVRDDPHQGFEANYARDLAHLGWGRWGLKLALGFTGIQIRDSRALNGNLSLVSDAYSLGGITAPLAPYAGSFGGPGPAIGDTPTRTTSIVQGGALITGTRQLDVWLYDLRLGPYLELPLVKRLNLQVGSGLAAGLADSTFSFSETTTSPSGTVQTGARTKSTGSLLGFYGEAGVAYQFLRDTSLFAGGQFEYLGEFHQNAAGRGAQLDLRRSAYFVVGVQLHF